MKTIYISGAITGTADYKERFAIAAEKLKESGKYFKIANPVHTGELVEKYIKEKDNRKPTWQEYMTECLSQLIDTCNCIYMLKGWQHSRGAVIEHDLAKELGYEIIYEEKDK